MPNVNSANRKYLRYIIAVLGVTPSKVLAKSAEVVFRELIMASVHDTSNAAANWRFFLNGISGSGEVKNFHGKRGVADKKPPTHSKKAVQNGADPQDRHRTLTGNTEAIADVTKKQTRLFRKRVQALKGGLKTVEFYNPLSGRYMINAAIATAAEAGRAMSEVRSTVKITTTADTITVTGIT